jgi:hypothetical protein
MAGTANSGDNPSQFRGVSTMWGSVESFQHETESFLGSWGTDPRPIVSFGSRSSRLVQQRTGLTERGVIVGQQDSDAHGVVPSISDPEFLFLATALGSIAAAATEDALRSRFRSGTELFQLNRAVIQAAALTAIGVTLWMTAFQTLLTDFQTPIPTDRKPAVTAAAEERASRVGQLLAKWTSDQESSSLRSWPEIRDAIEQDRSSSRRRFADLK